MTRQPPKPHPPGPAYPWPSSGDSRPRSAASGGPPYDQRGQYARDKATTTHNPPPINASIVDTAHTLIQILTRSRRSQWGHRGGDIPWSDRAAVDCAKCVIDLTRENERLNGRVSHLEKLLLGEGRPLE